ncbi:hypothetical protein HKBW3S25_01637, partial [Candidatus Hakubella thermalkaliphila]
MLKGLQCLLLLGLEPNLTRAAPYYGQVDILAIHQLGVRFPFVKALELVGQMYAGQLNEGIYVADSKLMNMNLFRTLMKPDQPIRFVSRCPASFGGKLEARTIAGAYGDGE